MAPTTAIDLPSNAQVGSTRFRSTHATGYEWGPRQWGITYDDCCPSKAAVPRRGDRQPAAAPRAQGCGPGPAARAGCARRAYEACWSARSPASIAQQEDIGLQVVTDGELARSSWFGFFFEGARRLPPGARRTSSSRTPTGRAFEWPTCVADRPHPPPRRRSRCREFERANRHVRRAVVKATMPAPSAFHFFRLGEVGRPSRLSRHRAATSTIWSPSIAPSSQSWPRPAAAMCSSTRCRSPCCATPTCCRQAAAEGGDPATLLDTYIGLLQRIFAGRPPA